jgi:MFS family permease
LVLTAGQIVLADISSPHNRGRVMAIYMGVFLFAVGGGSFPGGWLASTFTLATPFVANAVLAGIVTLVAWFALPETRELSERHASKQAGERQSTSAEVVRRLLKTPGFIHISAVSFTSFFARTGGLFTIIPLLAEDRFDASATQIGLGLSMISLVGLLLVYPSGMLVDRFGRKRVIVPSMILAGLAMFAYLQTTSIATFLIASIFWSAATGTAGAAPTAYAADVAPKGLMAATMSWYRSISDSGYVIGPLLLGGIADLLGAESALIFTALLLLASGAYFGLRAPESWSGTAKPQVIASSTVES